MLALSEPRGSGGLGYIVTLPYNRYALDVGCMLSRWYTTNILGCRKIKLRFDVYKQIVFLNVNHSVSGTATPTVP